MPDLNKNSILILVRLSKLGNKRKVPTSMVQVDADQSSISVSKDLLECAELGAINRLDGEIRQWLYNRSLPSGVLKEGVYRLPTALVEEVDRGLKDYDTQRKALIHSFVSIYPNKVEEARNRLRALYNPGDYPPVEQIFDSFDFQWG